MAKKRKTMSMHPPHHPEVEDRISDLPQPLLHHILSFLPTKQVVQTCVLSKTWKHIWRSVPSLDFHYLSFRRTENYHKFIDYVLGLHPVEDSNIKKLCITCWEKDLPKINSWIISTIKLNVQVLDLKIVKLTRLPNQFQLTRRILTCSSLRILKLDLDNFCLNFPNSVQLPLVKILHFQHVRFCNENRTESLFPNCPVLESLVLESCNFKRLKCLKIQAQQLTNLTLKHNALPFQTTISTPKLIFFTFHTDCLSGYNTPLYRVCFTTNLIALSKADVNVDYCKYSSELMIDLIRGLRIAQSLTLSRSLLESWVGKLNEEMRILVGVKMSVCNLKWLKLETCFHDYHILRIHTLLKCSDTIETLILENYMKKHYHYIEAPSEIKQVLWSDYMLLHLKWVRFEKFRGRKNEVKFVKFLLKNAVALEKLVIVGSTFKGRTLSMREAEMKRIRKELLIHPAASSSVEISFM